MMKRESCAYVWASVVLDKIGHQEEAIGTGSAM